VGDILISSGALDGMMVSDMIRFNDGITECPLHAGEFDVRTYPNRIESGSIYVHI
jgi:nitrite reductase/ring-hydroxylating ferredoxin subunit